MIFTKEKLQQLENAAYDTHCVIVNGGSFDNTDLDQLVEAATALPKYIAALEEAERALEQYEMALNEAADDYNKIEKVCLQYGLMSSHREAIETAAYIRAMLHGHSKALTTIRQLARGNAQ